MKRVYAKYTHSTIGFPGIVLNWHEEDGVMEMEGYVTKQGIIQQQKWKFRKENTSLSIRIQQELIRFDEWVREHFADDPTVQG